MRSALMEKEYSQSAILSMILMQSGRALSELEKQIQHAEGQIASTTEAAKRPFVQQKELDAAEERLEAVEKELAAFAQAEAEAEEPDGETAKRGQADAPLASLGESDKARDYGRRVTEAAAKWAQVVDDFFAKKLHRRTIMQFGQTPDLLVEANIGIPSLPMVMEYGTGKKMSGQDPQYQDKEHHLTPEQMKLLPEKLADPVMVLRSDGRRPGHFLIVTDEPIGDAPIMVGIVVNETQGNIQVNSVTTAFGKNNFATWLGKETGEARKGNIAYLNKEKSDSLLQDRSAPQLARVLEMNRLSGNKIVFDSQVVKPIYETDKQPLPSFAGERSAMSESHEENRRLFVDAAKEIIEKGEYEYYALRRFGKPNEEVARSRRWDDGDPVHETLWADKRNIDEYRDNPRYEIEEYGDSYLVRDLEKYEYLDGVSGIEIKAGDIDNALKNIGVYGGEEIALIGGNKYMRGEDRGEVVMRDPVVLYRSKPIGQWEKPDPRILASFAGERSAMSEPVRNNLTEAQRLAEAGTGNEAVRQKTGWFKGMDGKWRYEIPDDLKKINLAKLKKSGSTPLANLYENQKLYEAYPWLRDIHVFFDPEMAETKSQPSGGYVLGNDIFIGGRDNGLRSRKVLLHEIQHLIQKHERFAKGGTEDTFTGSKQERRDKYMRLAGEIEANNVADRAEIEAYHGGVGDLKPILRSDAIVLFGGEQVAAFSVDDPRQQQYERAARVKEIQEMPAQAVTLGKSLRQKEAESLARTFGKMENRRDHRITKLPTATIGKILRYAGFDVTTILGDMPNLYKSAIFGWSEKEKQREGHKPHPNIKEYHNYINKFAGSDGREYYIRLTVQEMMPERSGDSRNFVHSSFVSEVAVYNEKGESVIDTGNSPGKRADTPFDKKLQDFFNSVNPDLTSKPRGSIRQSPPTESGGGGRKPPPNGPGGVVLMSTPLPGSAILIAGASVAATRHSQSE